MTGRPYNCDESNAQVVSQFPPFAPTLIGAARAAFARRLGWPVKEWRSHVKAKFGDGEDLGPVSFSGPYVMQGPGAACPRPVAVAASRGWPAYPSAAGPLAPLRPR